MTVLWLRDELVGKVGGVFSVGGGYGDAGAGVEIAQLGLLAAMPGFLTNSGKSGV
ncbi:hypothetical protein LC609_26750 [Nostoc sp. XA013]|nr:hypothetical protein [Nostoc sp. XA013]